jgi:MFS transporter, OFA family, oxalate/formate antiporter
MPSSTVRLLGLPAQGGRWLLLALCLVMSFCLGSGYSWSVFRAAVEQSFGVNATTSLLPYTALMVIFSLLMPIAGRLIDRYGPRPIAMLGAVIMGCGYVAAGFSSTMVGLVISYGLVAGVGSGLVYSAPIAVIAQWFPDYKGLAVGCTVAGFGLSPLITAPLARHLIDFYGQPSVGGPIAHLFGWQATLVVLGLGFAAIILAIATRLCYPPSGWTPSPWTAAELTASPADSPMAPTMAEPTAELIFKRVNSSTTQTMTNPIAETIPETSSSPQPKSRRTQFYGLWFCLAIAVFAGSAAMGIAAPVAQELVQLDANQAAWCVSLFALSNGMNRPLFGWLTDRYSPKQAALASYGLIVVASGLMLTVQGGQVVPYLLAFCGITAALGGWIAIAPTTTLRLSPPERYASDYGWVFTAAGVGALLGTLTAGQIRDWLGSYSAFFYITGALAVGGMGLALLLLPGRSPHPAIEVATVPVKVYSVGHKA